MSRDDKSTAGRGQDDDECNVVKEGPQSFESLSTFRGNM